MRSAAEAPGSAAGAPGGPTSAGFSAAPGGSPLPGASTPAGPPTPDAPSPGVGPAGPTGPGWTTGQGPTGPGWTTGSGWTTGADPWSRRAQREARRAERRAYRASRGPGSGAVALGLLLILVGAWALVRTMYPAIDIDRWWPIALVILGAVLIVGSFRRTSGPG